MATSVSKSALDAARVASTGRADAAEAQATPASRAITVRTPDLCVIGAGAGGLSVAAAAAALGVSVMLIEKHKMGGECLNTGCVPSKALIAAAHHAQKIRDAAEFGVVSSPPRIEIRTLQQHVRGVVDGLAPNDSAARFVALGADVVHASARFVDARTLEAGDIRVKARRFVIATGSSPAIPAIAGLDTVPYLTNETIFSLSELPGHLAVLGGGAVGMELAQAYRRLGARVTVLEKVDALVREDPEVRAVVVDRMRDEGVAIEEGVDVDRIGGRAGAIEVHFSRGTAPRSVTATHLLVASGRKANVDRLGLEAAGIKIADGRIDVGPSLLTTNKRVYAIGSVVGGNFTHVANAHAEIVIRRSLFRQPARVPVDRLPRVIFTDPELAVVGLSEAEARTRDARIAVYRWPFADNDRAVIEKSGRGFVKVVCSRRGRILGAAIVGPSAGELIGVWSLAISQRLGINAMTGWIAPYPTLGEISKRVAVAARADTARSPLVRNLLTFLRKLG